MTEYRPANGKGTSPVLASWERRLDESSAAFAAFEQYRLLGAERSISKVSQKLLKSVPLLARWSSRHEWVSRSRDYDRYEARRIHEQLLGQLARLRERDLKLADSLDEKSRLRLDTMKADEIDSLSPMELATLIRVSSDLKYKATDISREETVQMGFPVDLAPPVFVIQSIPERPVGYVYVRFGEDPIRDGWTWIKEEEVAEYRKAHPDHFVIA